MKHKNTVTLVGEIVSKPKYLELNEDTKVLEFRLFTDAPMAKCYHTIKAWNALASKFQELEEGETIQVKGAIRSRKYENKQGVDVRVTEINAEDLDFVL